MDKANPRFDDLSIYDAWELMRPPSTLAMQTEALAALVYLYPSEHAKLAGFICRELDVLALHPGEGFERRHLLVCAASSLVLSSRAVKNQLADALLREAQNLINKAQDPKAASLLSRALRGYLRLRGPEALENFTSFLQQDAEPQAQAVALRLVGNTLSESPLTIAVTQERGNLRATVRDLAQTRLREEGRDWDDPYLCAYLAVTLLGAKSTEAYRFTDELVRRHDLPVRNAVKSALEEALESWRMHLSFEDERLVYLEGVCQRLRGRQSTPQYSTTAWLQANEVVEAA